MLDRNSQKLVEIFDVFLRSGTLEDLVARASAVVGNPVALIDAGYNMLAWSHYETVPDPIWQERIREGCWDYDFVAMVKRVSTGAGGASRRSVIVADISPLRRRIDTLVLNGRLYGYSVILESENNLEQVDEELYAYVRDILTKAMEAGQGGRLGRESERCAMFLDLLHTRFPSKALFRERIKGSEFDRESEFQLFSLLLERYSPPEDRKGNLKAAIADIFPGCWSVVDNEHIVLLIDRTAALRKRPDAFEAFSAFLSRNGFVAGQSTPFTDLFFLGRQKEQTLRALEIAASGVPLFHLPKDCVIIPYEACKIPDLLRHIPENEWADFCHSDILALADYDLQHGSDYLRTLFAYLNAARSIHAAAEVLHVHHNTVYYRITKLRELFHLDFSSEYRNVHYYLSAILLLHTA